MPGNVRPERHWDGETVIFFCPVRAHTHKLSLMVHPAGLLLWCRECRGSHLLSWAEVDNARRSLALAEQTR